jgi:hypothetical protein
MAKLAETMRTLRESGELAKEDLSDLFQSLEIVNRHQSIADALEECRSIIQTLQLHCYVGDYRLWRASGRKPEFSLTQIIALQLMRRLLSHWFSAISGSDR